MVHRQLEASTSKMGLEMASAKKSEHATRLDDPGEGCLFCGFRLARLVPPTARNRDEAYCADLIRRQVLFLTTLLQGSDDRHTYDLRIISCPDAALPLRGEITIAILFRMEQATREEAEAHSLALYNLLDSHFDEYRFEPLDSVAVRELLCPFPLRHCLSVRRRSTSVELDTANGRTAKTRLMGFRDGLGAGKPEYSTISDGTILLIPPIAPSHESLSQLFRLLLLHHSPLVISSRLQPASLDPQEEKFLGQQIINCERYAQVSLGSVSDDLSGLQPTLRELARVCQDELLHTLFRLKKSAAVLTLELTSPEPIPPVIAEVLVAPLSAAARGIHPASANGSAIAGGSELLTEQDTTSAARRFEALDINLPPAQDMPKGAERLIYLFDPTEAVVFFRLPFPAEEGVPGLENQRWRDAQPPPDLPQDGCLMGTHSHHGTSIPVRIGAQDRLRSMYVVGKTGTGKTTALETMILDDIESGRGVCVIDPHGCLYQDILQRIPRYRAEDVVLIDPSDAEFPVGLNLLEVRSNPQRYFIVQEIAKIMGRLLEDEFGSEALGDFTGPVFFQHVKMNLLLCMSNPNDPGTLLEFYTIFQVKDFWRRWLPLGIDDSLLGHWVEEVLPRTNYIAPGSDHTSLGGYIGSKFEGFVVDPMLRNIFAQKRSTINLREIMNSGKILLVNLAKGQLAEANSRFLGMLLLAKLQAAAMERINDPAETRRDFYVYVDEFQSIATQNFISLLSEGRKFGLGMILANQFISQVRDQRIIESALGNVGTLVSFRLGPYDAALVEREMLPEVGQADLMNLPNFHAYMKTLINGEPTRPFSIRVSPPAVPLNAERVREITASSREKYGRPRREVEREIRALL